MSLFCDILDGKFKNKLVRISEILACLRATLKPYFQARMLLLHLALNGLLFSRLIGANLVQVLFTFSQFCLIISV